MKNGTPSNPDTEEDWQKIVTAKVKALRFGLVQIIVHEGKVTQIEATEKTRLESRADRTERSSN